MTAAEPQIDRTAPTLAPTGERVVMRQDWRDLLFLHWTVPASDIQRLLPPGLTVDRFEGQAYIGLVPFTMRNVRPVWSPPVPWLSHFHEVNVRTYVHHNGVPGVWFFSLDAANPVAVAIARSVWHLPYFHAHMTVSRGAGGAIAYTSTRTGAGGAGCDIRYTPTGAPAASLPGTLEHFLAERYLLYAAKNGRLWRGQVHHTLYPLQAARVETLTDTLVAAAGFAVVGEPLAHYAGGVDVNIYPLRPL